jgi:hypothetical protein
MMLSPQWRRRLKRPLDALIIFLGLIAAYVLWAWYQDGGGFEAIYVALGVVLAGLMAARSWLYREAEATPDQLSPAALVNPRNRENLLNHLETSWIDGFLKQSLHSETLKLTLHQRPEAVGLRPWQLTLKRPGQSEQPVPLEQSLLELFTAVGRNLLILGEPGSGKTITMLQLAEPLIATARQDPTAPLPLILNLSSWAREKKPLTEWMAEEAFVQYGIARSVTRAGIVHQQFLYLLDGLDEVTAEARDGCVEAINLFKQTYPAEMVVCSRTAEYETLQHRLNLGAAVQIQPLTEAQINAYLSQEGLELQAVRATLTKDEQLKELAKTPLTLSLMTLAYRGATIEELRPLADKDARRRHLFDHYVRQMFELRPLFNSNAYTQEQAIDWLANLAWAIIQYKQSIFYIERLQPAWLGEGRWRRYYKLLTSLMFGLIVGIIVSLIGGLGLGIFVGVFFGLSKKRTTFIEGVEWQLPTQKILRFLLKAWLIGGLLGGVLGGLLNGLVGSIYGVLLGGVIVGLPSTIERLVVIGGMSGQSHPNQVIRRSGWVGVSMALIIGSLFGILGGWFTDISLGIRMGIFTGVIFGLFEYGGQTVIQHYTLRWLLARAGILLPYPLHDNRLIAFLDAMHSRTFLRRVGSGWIFVHRLLMEYFAELAKPRE